MRRRLCPSLLIDASWTSWPSQNFTGHAPPLPEVTALGRLRVGQDPFGRERPPTGGVSGARGSPSDLRTPPVTPGNVDLEPTRSAIQGGEEPQWKLDLLDDARNSRWSRPPALPAGGGGLVSTVDDHLAEGLETMTTDHLTQEQKRLGGRECPKGELPERQ